MNKYILKYASILFLLLSVGMVSCDDRDDEITELHLDRVISPYDITYKLSNIVDLTLEWKDLEEAEGYIIELYTDSLEFNTENFVLEDEVLTNKYETILQGNTRYSARIKSVSTTNNDSKWNGITFKTSFKSAFLPKEDADVTFDSAIFRWPAGTTATKVVLVAADGTEIEHVLTADEVTKGIVKIEGLLENTRYTATLYNGKSELGVMDITTPLDVGDAIVINNKEELKAKLATANDGDLFLLAGGVYDLFEALAITKNITIAGNEADKPILNVRFDLDNLNKVEFKHLIMDGKTADGSSQDYPFSFQVKDAPYGDIFMEGLEIKNYGKTLISAGSSFVTSVESLNIHDCIIGDISGDGNSAIDVRNGLIKEINITNSTLYNISPGYDFIRMDAKFVSPDGASADVLFKNSTINGLSSSGKIVLYIRYTPSTTTVENTIFSNMGTGRLLNSSSAKFDGVGNNYYKADAVTKQDAGTYSEFDPEYLDMANGNFTVGSTSVLVGDPRWLK